MGNLPINGNLPIEANRIPNIGGSNSQGPKGLQFYACAHLNNTIRLNFSGGGVQGGAPDCPQDLPVLGIATVFTLASIVCTYNHITVNV